MTIFTLISLIVFLLLCLLLSLVGLGIACYYLIKFARIIFSIEDHLQDVLKTLSEVDVSLNGLLTMKLFFDSKEVKYAVDEALSSVKLSKIAMVQLINDFTRFSKEKYITVRSNDEDEEEQDEEQE